MASATLTGIFNSDFHFCYFSWTLKLSGIHRYMNHKIDWLREVTGNKDAAPVSRAHLPRMRANLDWLALSCVITDGFGV